MALIAVSTEHPGLARIFFDLRPAAPSQQEQSRIASAIEQAVANIEAGDATGFLPDASVS
ncbi:MAG TPA: hypothetical protein VHY82_02540 [Acetobacteraceae bacterium]|nr:hypothetical protein [Acetobacteraceae bacterium]